MTTKIVFNDSIPKRGRYEKQSFDMAEVTKFSGPGVYVFYMNKEPLYVGSGKCVMGRCMGIHHKDTVRKIATRVEIHPCPTHDMALRLEENMIQTLKPRFNDRKTTISRVIDTTYAY